MAEAIAHKRGDTFTLDGTLTTEGAAVDLTLWAVAAQVRRPSGELVVALILTWLDRPAGKYQLSAADTTAWPLGLLEMDIEYTLPSGQLASTETLAINCVKDITQ